MKTTSTDLCLQVRASYLANPYTKQSFHVLVIASIGYNSTKEKAKLQNMMAYGSDLEPEAAAPKGRGMLREEEEEEEEIDRFEEVLGEIEERRQFLADMAALGQDRPHRTKIMTEISQV